MERRVFIAGSVALLCMKGIGHAEQRTIEVGVEASNKPFVFIQNGRYTGFSIDLWNEITKELGIESDFKAMDFSALIPALQTRNIDVAFSSIFITPKRQQVVEFSDPYYMDGTGVLVPDGSPIDNIAALAGKRIASMTGSAQVDFIKLNLPTATQTQFPDVTSAYFAMQANRVDAVLYDYPTLAYYAATDGKGKVHLLKEHAGPDVPCGFAFPKGSPLVEPTNQAIKKLRANGRYDVLSKKWFGS